MTKQLCQQLSTLNETQNYCHLDIKPTNIMKKRRKTTSNDGEEEDEEAMYTVIDFGFAMETSSIYDGYVGTKEWSAPEMKPMINGNNKIYESTDMWSIALIIIYCMFNGKHPFCTIKQSQSVNLKDIQFWYNQKIKNKQLF
eukprot:390094_1